MSRYKVTVDDDRYLTVGWDRPLNSFFFQLWNLKDELRMNELEEQGWSEDLSSALQDELDSLYEKYKRTGGEPIIEDYGADGMHFIPSIDDLVQRTKHIVEIPDNIKSSLEIDFNTPSKY